MTSFTALYTIILSVAITLAAVHEKSSTNGWTLVKAASDNTTLTLSVALVRENLDQLESKLASLATPGHSLYGQWMGIDDIESTFPTVSDIAVTNWLKNAGVTQIHREGSFVNFATDIGTANKLLNTTFAWYGKGSSLKLRTTEYSIPQDLTSSIDIILPTVFFGNDDISTAVPFESLPATFPVNSTCDNIITPDCLRDMYQLGDFTPDASRGSRIGYANFLNQSSSYADVELFQTTFNLPAHNFSVELINGGINNQESFGEHSEADLDVELIIALTYPLPVTSFITGGSPPLIPNLDLPATVINSNEPFMPFYEFLLSQPNSALPQVISSSYADDEQTVPEQYAKRVCNLIGLIGLRGISVLTSSGDTGMCVGSACQSNDETKTPQFTPQFPGTCPFITTVGGTQSLSPEVAWSASSGGFSYYFDRPWYQDIAVDQYLGSFISEGTKEYYQRYTNFQGRGFPDVSAHSLLPAFEIAAYGQLGGTGGTSASCPVFSSLISLLNDVRLQAGKPVLGFLNPFLYSIGRTGLNDIRGGGSGGCQGIDLQNGEQIPGVIPIPYASWNATYGWDPVTGLGTPNFEKLKELALTF